MANAYLPRADEAALVWMRTFAGAIDQAPQRYMLSPADAASIQGVVERYAAALATTADPAGKTLVSVRAKDEARAIAEQVCQQYYSLIKPNAGVCDADKIAIGVRPLNRARQRIDCPASAPLLSILGATPASHTLRYRDTSTPHSSGKPFGAIALQLFRAIGDAPAKSVEDARFYGSFTRNPVGVEFAPADDGKVATYFARWTSRRGEVGPWSNPASMRIAA